MINIQEVETLKVLLADPQFLDRSSVVHNAAMHYMTNYLNAVTAPASPDRKLAQTHGLQSLRHELVHTSNPFSSRDNQTAAPATDDRAALQALQQCITPYLSVRQDGRVNFPGQANQASQSEYVLRYCQPIQLPRDQQKIPGAGAAAAARQMEEQIRHDLTSANMPHEQIDVNQEFANRSFNDLRTARNTLDRLEGPLDHNSMAARARLIVITNEICDRLKSQGMATRDIQKLQRRTDGIRDPTAHGNAMLASDAIQSATKYIRKNISIGLNLEDTRQMLRDREAAGVAAKAAAVASSSTSPLASPTANIGVSDKHSAAQASKLPTSASISSSVMTAADIFTSDLPKAASAGSMPPDKPRAVSTVTVKPGEVSFKFKSPTSSTSISHAAAAVEYPPAKSSPLELGGARPRGDSRPAAAAASAIPLGLRPAPASQKSGEDSVVSQPKQWKQSTPSPTPSHSPTPAEIGARADHLEQNLQTSSPPHHLKGRALLEQAYY